jgi:hypothetical protein
MRMRLAIIGGLAIVLGSTAPALANHFHAGGEIKLMPVGSIGTSSGTVSDSSSTSFAFGLQGFFDYEIVPHLYLGVAPQLIFNVKSSDSSGSSAQELDLFGRVMVRYPVADKIQLFGYLAPGFSVIFVPDKPSGFSNPTGFVLGFAGGVSYSLSPTLFVAGEIGYQFGFQSSGGADFKTQYLHIGFAFGAMFE